MDYVYAFVQLLSGLGAFLIGFKILSENIEKAVDQVIDATEPEVDFGMEM